MHFRELAKRRVIPVNTLGVGEYLLSYVRGSVALHTLEHGRTDEAKCIVN